MNTNPFSPGSQSLGEVDPKIQELVSRAADIKAAREAMDAEYNEIKSELWALVGGQAGEIPGTKARFRAPAPRTRVNSKLLKSNYPEVYASVTETVLPDPETPGALYL
ncbi:hypothetical protein HOT45_gp62 [Gordonia phage Trine]|uniref:Uncharacterized protein n=1 Tax=Gordonia phage Trine TaxID=2201431 RepID=A0A2Z4QAD5_9CAUD|nr:hypothetical protein HOT45_gp62 [Gordonia phage Trine]AWY06563.1 hypothetical protein PBI_TRINE_62 [Gordonia phage Trine]